MSERSTSERKNGSRLKRAGKTLGTGAAAVVATATLVGVGSGAVEGVKVLGDRVSAEKGEGNPVDAAIDSMTPDRSSVPASVTEREARADYLRQYPDTARLVEYYTDSERQSRLKDSVTDTVARLETTFAERGYNPQVVEMGSRQELTYARGNGQGGTDTISFVRYEDGDVGDLVATSSNGDSVNITEYSAPFRYWDGSSEGQVEADGRYYRDEGSASPDSEGTLFSAMGVYVGEQDGARFYSGARMDLTTHSEGPEDVAQAEAFEERGLEILAQTIEAIEQSPEPVDGF